MSKKSNRINVPEAREAMDKFKMEAANEVGVNLKQGYNGDLTSREAGSASFCFFARGSAPSGASRQTRLLLPPVGLPGPHPGFLSFHDERNQRRAGAVPLDPLRGGTLFPPCGVAAPPK